MFFQEDTLNALVIFKALVALPRWAHEYSNTTISIRPNLLPATVHAFELAAAVRWLAATWSTGCPIQRGAPQRQ
jgi:hypothetical protein